MKIQIRPSLFSMSLIWIVCMIIVASAFQASGMEGLSDSALSPYGLTDQQFKKKLKEYIGIPYRKGGMSKKGMDCSGFVRTVYTHFFGIDLPNSAGGQFGFSEFKKIDAPEMQPGDLIFFANNKKKRITHVGVYLSERQFIHASSSQGVTVSSLDNRYWKKRFVGSKRHKALNSKPDYDNIALESILEIPVHQNGTFAGYARDEFRLNSFGAQHDLNTWDNTSFEPRDLKDSLLYLYEIGYGHTVFNGFDVNVSAIYEKFDAYTAWPGFEPFARKMSYPLEGALPDTADRLGLKLASAFRPGDWISITPSITYFDYSNEDEDLLNVPKWSFGLNTLVLPFHKRWSLSMLLQYSEGEDLTSAPSLYNNLSSLDMEIRLGLNLTENLRFSITGQHDRRTAAYGLQEDTLPMQSDISNIFMMFDLSY